MTAISVPTTENRANSALAYADPVVWIVVSFCIVMVGFYWSSIRWLAGEWGAASGTFSHGYFVVAISVWLLCRSTASLASIVVRPNWRVLPLVLATSLVWLLGYAANITVVQTTVMPALLLFALIASLGWAVASKVAFAILYLYLAFPVWDYAHVIFQSITVVVVEFALRVIGIAVFVDGSFVSIAPGTFEIAGGCSGVSFILVSLSLAALYGHLYYHSNRRHWILIAVALVIAVVSNWVRVSWVILVGHATDMKSSLVSDHFVFGWILFGFAMIPLIIFARYLEPVLSNPRVISTETISYNGRTAPMWAASLATVLALAVGPMWALAMFSPLEKESATNVMLPVAHTNWAGPRSIDSDWQPVFIGSSGEIQGVYSSENGHVWLYQNIYLSQQQGQELIYLKNSMTGAWRLRESQNLRVQLPNGKVRRVHQEIADSRSGRWVIWYWYVVGEREEVSPAAVKLWQALNTLAGLPEAGVIAFAARCELACNGAVAQIESLLANLDSKLNLKFIASSE